MSFLKDLATLVLSICVPKFSQKYKTLENSMLSNPSGCVTHDLYTISAMTVCLDAAVMTVNIKHPLMHGTVCLIYYTKQSNINLQP